MQTIVRSVIGYCVLLLTVRMLSRRPGGQLTLAEFVIVFLLGGVVIGATVGDDHSMVNCGNAILTIALMHRFVSWIRGRFPTLGVIIDGTPLLLIKKGEWQEDVIRRMRLQRQDIMAAARAKSLRSLADIKYAVLERNGTIGIIPREQGKAGGS